MLLVILLVAGSAAAREEPAVSLRVHPLQATIGDVLEAVLELHLPPGTEFDPTEIREKMSPFEVLGGSWSTKRAPDGSETTWTWTGRLAIYETGEHVIPALNLTVTTQEGSRTASTEPVTVEILSVLPDEDGVQPALSDIKGPASLAPDYRPMVFGLAGLLALLSLAGLIWYLQNRFGHRLSAVEQPTDPFDRMPPHVWAYQQLQSLLENGLSGNDGIGLFYEKLSRILKLYLSGRYRVDLMEQTTADVPGRLRQAGAPGEPIDSVLALLKKCDMVKFAGASPDPGGCRLSVEEAYRVVDRTRPLTEGADPSAQEG